MSETEKHRDVEAQGEKALIDDGKQQLALPPPTADQPPPDGGWRAWLVCVASCWTNGALFGLINNFGVIYKSLGNEYGGNKAETDSVAVSLVGSLCIGTTFLLSPVAAFLTDRIGIRTTSLVGAILVISGIILSSLVHSLELMYLTYGIIFGAGASLAYTPSLVILGHYFKRRLSVVNGIVAAGSGITTIVLPMLIAHLLTIYPLSVIFQMLLFLMIPLLANAWVFQPLYNTNRGENNKLCATQCTQLVSNWRNKKYMVWSLAFPVCLLGYFVPYVHLVKHVGDILPGYKGEVLITCMGAASLIGRILCGFVADVPGVSRILLQQISFLSIGVLTMLIAAAEAYWILIVIVLGMGVFDGCFVTLLGPIAFDLVGPQGASQAIGFVLGLCSVPLTLGPPIAGWMYDNMGRSYVNAFVAAGIPPIVGALLMFLIRLVKVQAPPAAAEPQELEHMLKPSETKESKMSNGDENDESAVWKRQDGSYRGPAVSLLGMKPLSQDEDKAKSELVERQSTC